ncbi:MAG: hypothetical protein A2487_15285 [Candidatus Raymondbacteria bacterium RifOxyC12_full_50_8]|uniref:DUF3800 domain-containing protein n=1 Tax=Candidatus Raymondbacteria bacterium RIFOXYD12_FULL_49_13 TaxID=1817890 RepID=A0A1F7FH83_UNCRA|nr:MAG: hypothetical protein A2248_05070 [Candidatus Raymondbacteria bacterium RIFOXYA2_FULL_49_16]OGJ94513.1 MAG: hypothetical protein A2487_15285 [Candidatus Raymondbacteria bacterium RifOxyC12_full_50_8]OGJ99275.1 MAG: hypothetical protein A2350_05370 [Candidatus Raymondbacteria bacterium RifOxyB12_full_50_8]OGK05867.1 MAG: hypothetical protein A2519_04245 [Candidatus Raymondbacteria bacterium RIFOXYD12_FULL_49_13]OGP43361.1 MAG: hypothetical protein A2324_02710 [Candidatus Raymondbacteria b
MSIEKLRYRLYIDESGDHTFNDIVNPARRFLGITGCILESGYYRLTFQPGFEALKQRFFPHSPDQPVILHRTDLINRRGRFWPLRDKSVETAFNQTLLDFLKNTETTLLTVVLDKKSHMERFHEAAMHPYHYCIVTLVEKYAEFLREKNGIGDVLAENRGGHEDIQLKGAYRALLENGTIARTPSYFKQVLSSSEIKIKPKSANIAGTQLADLLAHPCKQATVLSGSEKDVWESSFGARIYATIEDRFFHGKEGKALL